MARVFTAGDNVISGTPASTFQPYGISAWIYPTTVAPGTRRICSCDDNFCIRDINSGSLNSFINAGSGADVSSGSGTLTANEWQHVATHWIYHPPPDDFYTLHIYRNGIDVASGSISQNVNACTSFYIGHFDPESWEGYIAEVAIWSFVLTPSDVAQLAVGVSPLFVRPDILLYYVPGLLTGADRDIVGQSGMGQNGSVGTVDHPPGITYPISPFKLKGSQAAVTGWGQLLAGRRNRQIVVQ